MEFGENPGMAFWDQGVNDFADNLVGNQVPGLTPIPAITPADVLYLNNNNNDYIESGSSCRRNFDTDTHTCLNHIEKTLMSDAHTDYTDQEGFSQCSLESIATMQALISQSTDNNLVCNTNSTSNTIYGQNMPVTMYIDLPSNETAARLIFQPWMSSLLTEIQQPIPAVIPPQVTNEIPLSYYDCDTADNHHHHHGQNSWP